MDTHHSGMVADNGVGAVMLQRGLALVSSSPNHIPFIKISNATKANPVILELSFIVNYDDSAIALSLYFVDVDSNNTPTGIEYHPIQSAEQGSFFTRIIAIEEPKNLIIEFGNDRGIDTRIVAFARFAGLGTMSTR